MNDQARVRVDVVLVRSSSRDKGRKQVIIYCCDTIINYVQRQRSPPTSPEQEEQQSAWQSDPPNPLRDV